MAGSMAINGIGYDPYFMAAYSSPNILANQYATQMYGLQAASPEAQQSMTTTTIPLAQPEAKAAPQAEEKKSNKTAWCVIGAAAAIALCVLGKKAYNKGVGDGFFEKLVDGSKKLFTSTKESVAGKFKSSSKFAITEAEGKTVCSIPNRTNRIGKDGASAALDAIGSNANVELTDAAGKLAKDIKLERFGFNATANINGADTAVQCFQKGGKLTIRDSAGKLVDCSEAELKKLKDLATQYAKGENLSELNNITFSHTSDGVKRFFNVASKDAVPEFQAAATKRFAVGSDAVKVYTNENKKAGELLKNYTDGKFDKLKVAYAECDKGTLGTFIIKDGKIDGVRIGDTVYGSNSEKFKALYIDNKTTIDNILKNGTLTNKIYSV